MKRHWSFVIFMFLSFAAIAGAESDLRLDGVWGMNGTKECSNGLPLKPQNFTDYKIIVQESSVAVEMMMSGNLVRVEGRLEELYGNAFIKAYKVIPNQNAFDVVEFEIMQDRSGVLALYNSVNGVAECKGKHSVASFLREGAAERANDYSFEANMGSLDKYVKCQTVGRSTGKLKDVHCIIPTTSK